MHSDHAARTIFHPAWTWEELCVAKGDTTVSVVIPTWNEEERIAAVVSSIHPHFHSLVDEVVVLDSASTDRTVERARAAGARVVQQQDVIPEFPVRRGKGESLWRGVAASQGDLIVFMDGDLKDPDPRFVPWLLAPLLLHQHAALVKGFYRRPLGDAEQGGGRVTELVARPLLATLCPDARFLIQPLGGEYAVRRSYVERLPFAAGYGVEIGLVMDFLQWWGEEAVWQVNLGVRRHRNRPLRELGIMAREVSDTILRRSTALPAGAGDEHGTSDDYCAELWQFASSSDNSDYQIVTTEPIKEDRPPLVTVPSYSRTHSRQDALCTSRLPWREESTSGWQPAPGMTGQVSDEAGDGQ